MKKKKEPKMITAKKPRVMFCFECGRKLRGNHFIEAEVDGHKRIFHKSCIEVME